MGGDLIEEGSVGHFHTGEVFDHCLEIQERLHPTLRDLCLIRGVRGVPGTTPSREPDAWSVQTPGRILKYVSEDGGRGDRVVVTHPDV